ncbi:MAG: hypothetical protein ACP5NW_03050 [Candidatus Woesearchaeota archaeon]
MDTYEMRQKIGDCDIGVIFLFDEYTQNAFKKDIQEIIEYQNRQGFSEDKEERNSELDLKFYSNKASKAVITKVLNDMDYDLFKQRSVEVFSKFFFYFMKNNIELATSQEFNIQFKVIRIANRDYYFEYSSKASPADPSPISDPENACFTAGGSWLIHAIVLPSLLGTGNFSLIQRYMLHELGHHTTAMRSWDYWDSHYKGKMRKFYMKKSAYFLNCLYNSMFNLREEGLPEFISRKESPNIELNMNGVKKYNENLVYLSTLSRKSESQPFYEDKISTGNLTPSGEYTNGRNMCLTVALAFSKRLKRHFTVVIDGQKISSKDVNLNKLLSERGNIIISDLDKQVMEETIRTLMPLAHYRFLRVYEDACKELGIDEKNMVMTRRRFYGIVSDAIDRIKKEKAARFKKGGFKYVEKELKPL